MTNKGTIQLTQTTSVEYPTEEKEKRIAIRRVDWNRIKKLVGFIRPEPKFLRTAYSISFGIAVTAGFSVIPIYYIPQKSPWLLPLYICFAVFALALAIILFCVDKYYTTSKSKDLGLIHEDMQDIEDTFKRETGEEIEEEGIDKSMSALEVLAAYKSRSHSRDSKSLRHQS